MVPPSEKSHYLRTFSLPDVFASADSYRPPPVHRLFFGRDQSTSELRLEVSSQSARQTWQVHYLPYCHDVFAPGRGRVAVSSSWGTQFGRNPLAALNPTCRPSATTPQRNQGFARGGSGVGGAPPAIVTPPEPVTATVHANRIVAVTLPFNTPRAASIRQYFQYRVRKGRVD